jgi:hypothetical protein
MVTYVPYRDRGIRVRRRGWGGRPFGGDPRLLQKKITGHSNPLELRLQLVNLGLVLVQ